MMRFGIGGLLSVGVLTLTACQREPDIDAVNGRLSADGSSSVYPFIRAAADTFAKEHPAVSFDLVETGSGVGIKRLTDKGDISFANSSRAVELEELDAAEKRGRHLHSTVIAAEAVAIVVHPNSKLADLSLAQLKDLFFDGTTRDWSALPASGLSGPVHIVAVDPKISGTGEFFVEHVGGKKKPAYAEGAHVVADNQDVPAAILADPNAIGFCSQATATNGHLRFIRVAGVRPSEQSVLDTSYPINRRLFVLTDGQPAGATADFLLFMLSAPGQHIARDHGFTPVTLEVSL
jgi:phosphate transport system substrate-binding protein